MSLRGFFIGLVCVGLISGCSSGVGSPNSDSTEAQNSPLTASETCSFVEEKIPIVSDLMEVIMDSDMATKTRKRVGPEIVFIGLQISQVSSEDLALGRKVVALGDAYIALGRLEEAGKPLNEVIDLYGDALEELEISLNGVRAACG